MHGVKGTESDNCESMATLADAVEVTVIGGERWVGAVGAVGAVGPGGGGGYRRLRGGEGEEDNKLPL